MVVLIQTKQKPHSFSLMFKQPTIDGCRNLPQENVTHEQISKVTYIDICMYIHIELQFHIRIKESKVPKKMGKQRIT